jgi:hypothetical protein
MSPRPSVKLGDWINVDGVEAVVSNILPPDDPSGDCEVVFDPSKPTNLYARWTGEKWEFVKSGDYGGYAAKYSRLSQYVSILRMGRHFKR